MMRLVNGLQTKTQPPLQPYPEEQIARMRNDARIDLIWVAPTLYANISIPGFFLASSSWPSHPNNRRPKLHMCI